MNTPYSRLNSFWNSLLATPYVWYLELNVLLQGETIILCKTGSTVSVNDILDCYLIWWIEVLFKANQFLI